MKKIVALLIAIFAVMAVEAQNHNIVIDASSLTPVQTDALSGVAIDKIGKDTSQRPCARLKIHINRMTRAEIEDLDLRPVGGNVVVMKQQVAIEGNGLIVELTAKESTRFHIHHDKYGDSNEVSLNLEGDKEYKLSAQLNFTHSIVISCNATNTEIYLDGEYKGRTDDSFSLTINDVVPGIHKLKAQCGVSIAEKEIEVGTKIHFPIEINTITSAPQYVVFEVEPKDAIVVINDKSYIPDADGVVLTTLNNGSYNYHISANGYHEVCDLFVVNGSKVNKSIALKPAHGWVSIASNTKLQDASVYIDNTYVGKVPVTSYKLSSGEHKVKIIKNLYLPYEDTITISDGENLQLKPALTANFATVTVTTAKGADIYVNNAYKGNTTWTGDLEMGTYIFEARKESHRTTTLSHTITAEQQRESITIDAPTPINGSINITCSPSIANVKIDNEDFGDTPLMSELLVGKHTVTISKKGYKSYTTTVNIAEGQTENLTAKLEENIAPGYISVTSYPSGANVYIDGIYIGTTPTKRQVEADSYFVTVSKAGYYSKSKEITVEGGITQPMHASLQESLLTKTKRTIENSPINIGPSVCLGINSLSESFFEYSFGAMCRFGKYDDIVNVTTGFQYSPNINYSYIPIMVNFNLDLGGAVMYMGLGTDITFMSNYDYSWWYDVDDMEEDDFYNDVTLGFAWNVFGFAWRHSDFSFYLKFYTKENLAEGFRYTYFF